MTDLTARINGCFSENWQDTLPLPGWVTNQQPNKWALSFVDPGDSLFGADDVASGYAECIHKLSWQLPENEQMGGPDALILCHTLETAEHDPATYKIFSSGGGFGTELAQTVTGLKPGSQATITAHVWCDVPDSTDAYAAEFRMETQGQGGWWQYITKMPRRQWATRQQIRTVDDNGELRIVFQFKAKYSIPSNFFFDAVYLDAELADGGPVDPPPIDPPIDPPEPEPTPCDCDVLLGLIEAMSADLTAVEQRVTALENPGTTPPPLYKTIPARSLSVDVSAHQGDFNWEAAKANGCAYAILRSSNGMGSVSTIDGIDNKLFRNAAECERLSIPFGIYHYLQPDRVIDQADLWLSIWQDLIDKGTPPEGVKLDDGRTLPPLWIDVEQNGLTNAIVKQFHGLTCPAGIYSRANFWEALTSGVTSWWYDVAAWMAQWSTGNQVPANTAVPTVPRGFKDVAIWQFTSQGGAIMGWPYGLDVNLMGPFEEVTEPPPTGETLNIRKYFEPAGEVGPMKVLAWVDGSKTQPQQLLKRDGFVLEAKGEGEWHEGKRYDHYECYQFFNGEMRRWEDTSPGNLEAYTQHGAMWLPIDCEIGRQYVNRPRITNVSLVDCSVNWESTTTDYLTVAARHDHWAALNGIVVNDVIELEWRKSPAGNIEEVYFYGAGLGLVGWGVNELEAALSELPQGRAPLNPVLWGCG